MTSFSFLIYFPCWLFSSSICSLSVWNENLVENFFKRCVNRANFRKLCKMNHLLLIIQWLFSGIILCKLETENHFLPQLWWKPPSPPREAMLATRNSGKPLPTCWPSALPQCLSSQPNCPSSPYRHIPPHNSGRNPVLHQRPHWSSERLDGWLPANCLTPVSQCPPTLLLDCSLPLLWYPNPRRTHAQPEAKMTLRILDKLPAHRLSSLSSNPAYYSKCPTPPHHHIPAINSRGGPQLDQRPHKPPELQPPT